MASKLINSKQTFEIVSTSLCLGNISKDWSVSNMEKIGLNGYVYDLLSTMVLLALMIS